MARNLGVASAEFVAAQCAASSVPIGYNQPKLDIRVKSDIAASYSLNSNSLDIDTGYIEGAENYRRYICFTLPELENMLKFARSERVRQKKAAEQRARYNLKATQAL